MNCSKCGKPLEDTWVACPYCGTVLKKKKPAQKRGNRQGSVYKRGKTWSVRVTTATYMKDGKLYQSRINKGGFATKTEATEYIARLTSGDVISSPVLAHYWEAFKSGKYTSLSPSKQTAYTIAYNRLEEVQARQINSLTVGELQRIINEQCTSYYTARDVRVLLNHLFKIAAAEGKANAHLPELLQIPSLQETEKEPFTSDEQTALWKSYEDGNADAAYPLVMIYTGMMPGELLGMKVGMINFESKEIVGAGLKTKVRRERSILLPDAILPVLQSLAEGKDPEDKLVRRNKDQFYIDYYAALEKANVRKLPPYSCRHTTATALTIDEGIAPQTVQRIMRWSTTRMMDRYVHPDTEDARAALQTL